MLLYHLEHFGVPFDDGDVVLEDLGPGDVPGWRWAAATFASPYFLLLFLQGGYFDADCYFL